MNSDNELGNSYLGWHEKRSSCKKPSNTTSNHSSIWRRGKIL